MRKLKLFDDTTNGLEVDLKKMLNKLSLDPFALNNKFKQVLIRRLSKYITNDWRAMNIINKLLAK